MATEVYTLASMATEIRRILQDYDIVRYTEEQVYNTMNYAFSEMRRHRPDLIASRNLSSSTVFPYTVADGSMLAPFHHMYIPPIITFCAAWLELADDEFVNEQRVQALLTLFTASTKQGA